MINIFVNTKTLGKRSRALTPELYPIPNGIQTLRGLIEAVVEHEVSQYNANQGEAMLLPLLTKEQIDAQSLSGKVHFGRIYSDKKADIKKAIDVALQGYEDGLFRVMINKTEAKLLDKAIDIKEGDTVTFIKLTFLAGRLW